MTPDELRAYVAADPGDAGRPMSPNAGSPTLVPHDARPTRPLLPPPRRISGGADAAVPLSTYREPSEPRVSASVDIAPRPRSERLARALNVVIAGVALVAVSPLMLLFAALVKLTSRGPVFYSQARVGIDRRSRSGTIPMYDRRIRDVGGRAFVIYKFRTMRTDAEAANGAVWATRGDPRVTPLGRFMRLCRIDELPQLLNVIKGDMNIVGPRPERPSIFSRLRVDIAEYPLRQRARPGITGWAQINHSYDTTVDDVRTKVRYDLEYLRRQGIAEDLKIMAQTLPVMIFRKGGW